jgi:hypothetical protein
MEAVRLRDLYEIPTTDDTKRLRCVFINKGEYLPTDEASRIDIII